MTSVLKSAVLGLGLVVGVSVAAQAQSLSALPPSGAAPATLNAVTTPSSPNQGFYPKPGGMEAINNAPRPGEGNGGRPRFRPL
jgi:hypothetical protein